MLISFKIVPMKKLLLISFLIIAVNSTLFAQTMNTLSHKEQKDGFALLFDGTTTNGWHTYHAHDATGWFVNNGTLQVDTLAKKHGDLVTDKEFTNFELRLDWKIPVGGNSGVIFSIHEDSTYAYTYFTGMEMQVLDDINAEDNKQPNHLAGSLYDMIAPSHPAKPAGEWNSIVINKLNGHLILWLNGKKVVETQIGSPEWNELIQKSKFKGWKGFAAYATGHIALQYHGAAVAFRNIRIKEL
jgi:Domain of Unknown Function (DUF1080)